MISPDVIEACLAGTASAQQRLYEQSVAYANAVASRYVPTFEDRRDVLQEGYAQVFLHLDQFDAARGTFKGWLRRVVINAALMHLRRREARPVMAKAEPTELDYAAQATDFDPGQLSRRDIDELLEAMPPGYRLVFMLSVIDGFSHAEIAAQLDITADTSRSQLLRAKRWIQRNLATSPKLKQYGLT